MSIPITTLRLTAESFETRPEGDLFLGDLDLGKRIADGDRFVVEGTVEGKGFYLVAFCDEEVADLMDAWRLCAEWGCSEQGDPERAWRYALGAFLGPYDYDEPEMLIPVPEAS